VTNAELDARLDAIALVETYVADDEKAAASLLASDVDWKQAALALAGLLACELVDNARLGAEDARSDLARRRRYAVERFAAGDSHDH
jgi:hypothetical protein